MVGSDTSSWRIAEPSYPTDADGLYEVALDDEAVANRWWVYVVDGDGNQISPRVVVETDDADCQPGGNGVQVVFVNFKKTT